MATKSKYTKYIRGNPVDVYDVLQAWNVTCPALQHLLKKALQAGNRGNKTLREDLQDIVDSAIRAQELNNDLDREYDEDSDCTGIIPELFYQGTDKLCDGNDQQRRDCMRGRGCACTGSTPLGSFRKIDLAKVYQRATDETDEILCDAQGDDISRCNMGFRCACWARDQKAREEKAIAKKSMYNQTQL